MVIYLTEEDVDVDDVLAEDTEVIYLYIFNLLLLLLLILLLLLLLFLKTLVFSSLVTFVT